MTRCRPFLLAFAGAALVKEWIDDARKNPGELNDARNGNGTIVS